ncbi:sigma-70 family RNA polymerase sigma factor [Streptomyces flavofungini]|uniref:sigma-70 family RNA polymerase sigma factor n=1 Tax=Streptomyces flavofungini TaxID=68200 RepID=UPI0025AF7CC9|nr:sigma-70 family RNA polymerase sigma factor [Streptomyces flavofungini]WJV44623.1 sigma-70 family RNA polymerase sigma factor [Streptomyces flavofungini]
MNEVIRAGEEMRALRAEMIKVFVRFGWTQDRIARLTGMSQPAVSKQVAKYKQEEAPPPQDLSLDQHDVPWLEGRLWGLAEEIVEVSPDTAHCARHVHAVARGRKRFTPQHVDELRRLVEEDLRRRDPALPRSFRDAYDRISRGLDVPVRTAAAPGPASVRRALACQIQRERLRHGS